MDVISITKIMESSMKWGCKFQLNLTWVEGRVRWKDLSYKTNLNKISHVGPGQVYSTQENTQHARTSLFRIGKQNS